RNGVGAARLGDKIAPVDVAQFGHTAQKGTNVGVARQGPLHIGGRPANADDANTDHFTSSLGASRRRPSQGSAADCTDKSTTIKHSRIIFCHERSARFLTQKREEYERYSGVVMSHAMKRVAVFG